MFDKIEYELLILKYMPKDEYKKLIKTYMTEYTIYNGKTVYMP
jgi:hypothetical protein